MAKAKKPIKKAATNKVAASAKTPKSKPYVKEAEMTKKQAIAFSKLDMSPKTSSTLFTTPKGTTNLTQAEIDAIQRRRTLDRKRTLARAKGIIRRDVI